MPDTGPVLLVVDVQLDFCEGGSMGVEGGAATAAAISRYLGEDPGRYSHVVASRDYHQDPGDHFSDAPDFAASWPPHCRAGTAGAAFHPELDVSAIGAVFSKGLYEAAYSAFEGTGPGAAGLAGWLRDRGVTELDVVGIATDHCVRASALDAVREGFTTTVLLDLTAGVAEATTAAALDEMREAGVVLAGGG